VGRYYAASTSPRGRGITTKPPRDAPSARPTPSRVDRSGVYRQWSRLSYAVIGTYVFLLIFVVLVFPHSSFSAYSWTPWAIGVFIVLFLVRYLSTSYSIDDSHLRAWRILGGRRIRLETVRKIEYSSLRDLAAGGFFGSWGWRGRMWSAQVGHLDAIYTDAARGLLVSVDGVPLYISPSDLVGFARELSRRVRSYSGRLSVDVGDPLGGTGESDH